MNVNPSLTLKEQYGPKSHAWQEQQSPPIVRFWCDDGTCWAIPFFQIAFMHYHPTEHALLMECAPGVIFVTGPKAGEFLERFCSHRVASVKADGKDILAVTMESRGGAQG
jgi:hypothetical protein